jgi:SAM-dependent methyltransferase
MHLPIADAQADVVLAMHMIYHLPDIDVGVAELARVLTPGGLLIASTNARNDKAELDQLWASAASDVLGVAEGPRRVSLSNRFSLDDAPAVLARYFENLQIIELPGTVTVTEPEPVIAHLASYRTWADQTGVPFDPTIDRARERLTQTIEREGVFSITCRGGILLCRASRNASSAR